MKIFLVLVFGLIVLYATAQEHDHDDHRNHFGLGLGASALLSGSDAMPNIHLHFLRKTAAHSDWSVGLGYESILGEHAHQTITALVNYELIPHFTLNAGPGISFGKEDGHSHVGLSGHVELLYEFSIGEFHLGPMVGFGFDKDDSHASLGLHLGFGF